MKIAILTALMSLSAFAAPLKGKDTKTVEAGLYQAIDVETKTIIATLNIREDHTLNFKVVTPDFTMPEPGCEGQYKVIENNFISDLECPLDFLSEVQVQIDIKDVTPESVLSENGVNVDVVIDALGSDPFKFNLKKMP